MSERKYEEMMPYAVHILKWLDHVGEAIIRGNTGSIEISMAFSYIFPDMMIPMETDIEEINKMFETERKAMLDSWTVPVGYPGDGKTETIITLTRKDELNKLEALANQMKVNKIMDALHKNGMLLTNSTMLPTSVV